MRVWGDDDLESRKWVIFTKSEVPDGPIEPELCCALGAIIMRYSWPGGEEMYGMLCVDPGFTSVYSLRGQVRRKIFTSSRRRCVPTPC